MLSNIFFIACLVMGSRFGIGLQQVELCRWLQCTPLKEQIRDISALKNLSELSNLDKYHSIKG